MKMVESSDGSVRVIEMDPTKIYWCVITSKTPVESETLAWLSEQVRRDGVMLLKQPDTIIEFVESDLPPAGFVTRCAASPEA
jgi:hypothetical protein